MNAITMGAVMPLIGWVGGKDLPDLTMDIDGARYTGSIDVLSALSGADLFSTIEVESSWGGRDTHITVLRRVSYAPEGYSVISHGWEDDKEMSKGDGWSWAFDAQDPLADPEAPEAPETPRERGGRKGKMPWKF
ncbi:MAG: hypothetical protein KJ558_10280 [Gammaproteobacteria bacterium]|nr:hypothetical protein [Gammaproteobacteria bacterium]MBU1655194.1 hypothetical protein [Gammaproteobacteria bacterium]MBU1960005.1 hypothetical protein [Gammaproteobacteria bacterium]